MLLCWVTVLITHLWWEVGSLWISSVLTAFCCLESLSALSQVKVYTQVCFCTSCHILISSFLQQAYISSKFAEPDWLHTRGFCCNWRSFSCFSDAVWIPKHSSRQAWEPSMLQQDPSWIQPFWNTGSRSASMPGGSSTTCSGEWSPWLSCLQSTQLASCLSRDSSIMCLFPDSFSL